MTLNILINFRESDQIPGGWLAAVFGGKGLSCILFHTGNNNNIINNISCSCSGGRCMEPLHDSDPDLCAIDLDSFDLSNVDGGW